MSDALVLPFSGLSSADVATVGGKNASLGELVRSLADAGVRVPDGFATTASAYRLFLAHNALDGVIADRLAGYAAGRATLAETGAALREALRAGDLPPALTDAVRQSYAAVRQTVALAEEHVRERGGADPPAVHDMDDVLVHTLASADRYGC